MLFSLIVATVDRTETLEHLLHTLEAQTSSDFEVIVVDQNQDDRIPELLRKFSSSIQLIHLRSERGLSRARNVGLKSASGDIVLFPDDDCWYPPEYLNDVAAFLRSGALETIVLTQVLNENGQQIKPTHRVKSGRITGMKSVRRIGSSISMIIPRAVLDRLGGFDERLGVGSGTMWNSGEDNDLLLRAVRHGVEIQYSDKLAVFHPDFRSESDQRAMERVLKYGYGSGAVMRNNKYPAWAVLHEWIRPLGGALLSLVRLKPMRARFYLYVLRGKVIGWLTWKA